MRTPILRTLPVLLALTLSASALSAGTMSGTVKVGGIILDKDGDQTTIEETYNIFKGFSLDQIRLNGTAAAIDHFSLDLREINLDSRRGDFLYRRPGVFTVTADYDQYRELFTADGGVSSSRKDWKAGAQYMPVSWLRLSGSFNNQTRNGGRTSYPPGTMSVLGTGYDHALRIGEASAAVNHDRYGGAVTYRLADYNDENHTASDRRGQVLSARLHGPCRFYDKWTHLVRGAYGTSKLSNLDVETKLYRIQYTGVVAPVRAIQLKYNLDASRVDDGSTTFKTDRLQNHVDATWFHPYGQLSGGYGYETNDDDNALTHYNSWRAGAVLRYRKLVTARVSYAGRNKKDEEDLTLLKDVESNRFRARLQVRPIDALTVGGSYARREREFPDIQVEADGDAASGFARYAYPGWGSISLQYDYTKDTYDDRVAGFEIWDHVGTGRLDFDRIEDAQLGCGVTYLNVRGDLDIKKWLVFAEGAYRLRGNYLFEVKYNLYTYDDYILLDRYYTANVVRISIGYDFNLK